MACSPVIAGVKSSARESPVRGVRGEQRVAAERRKRCEAATSEENQRRWGLPDTPEARVYSWPVGVNRSE
jgi:hypothetical protein